MDCTSPVTVMPVGNSITRGSGGTNGGYRGFLWELFNPVGETPLYLVDFVGSLTTNDPGGIDPDHEGRSGWQADQPGTNADILGRIYAWLQAAAANPSQGPVDIILLHIGTNDISQNQPATEIADEISQILDEIDLYESDAGTAITVILARIINRNDGFAGETTALNQMIQSLADTRIAAGDDIIVVDMEPALTYPDDFSDSLHPNNTGYSKMADEWYSALSTILPICDQFPTITSTPVVMAVEGSPYQYDVQSVGEPGVTYALASSPAGMTIDQTSGLISWVPSGHGLFDVSVEVSNTTATSFQDFTIIVTADPGPTQTYLQFDGADDRVDITDSGALDLTGGELTVAAWIRPLGWGQNNQGRIIDNGGGSSGNAGWSFHVDNDSGSASLRFQVNNDFSFDNQSDLGVISLDQWQHVAVTLSGGQLTFYVNGTVRGVRSGVPTPLVRSTPAVRVGMRSTDTNRAFDGDIDDISIWDRALSAGELQDAMSAELSGAEPGLVAYYDFNQGGGQVLTDISGQGLDGRLGSSAGADGADPLWMSE